MRKKVYEGYCHEDSDIDIIGNTMLGIGRGMVILDFIERVHVDINQEKDCSKKVRITVEFPTEESEVENEGN